MGVDGGIAGCSCEIFVVFVGDVGAVEDVLLGEPKVDYEDSVALLVFPNQEVIRFYITMDEPLRVDVLDTIQYLQPDHHDSFQRKALSILLE